MGMAEDDVDGKASRFPEGSGTDRRGAICCGARVMSAVLMGYVKSSEEVW